MTRSSLLIHLRTPNHWVQIVQSANLLKTFDCKVLCNENGDAADGITLVGAAFGSQSHFQAHFLKFVSKTENILSFRKDLADPQNRFSIAAVMNINLPRVTSASMYSAGALWRAAGRDARPNLRQRCTVFTAFSVLHTNYEPKISEWKQHLVCRTLFRNVAHYQGINH